MMTHRTTFTTFYVEGPNWKETVEVDSDMFSDDGQRVLEAATQAIEVSSKALKSKFKLGPMVQVKEKGGKERTALVNTYTCLSNAGKHSLAQRLNVKFMDSEGQDLSSDEIGFSWL